MLLPDGEQRLRTFSTETYVETLTEIVPGTVFHALGYGHSNASFIIGNESVILIDSLDTDTRAMRLRGVIEERTDKPVRTIIFTHSHPDHVSGSGAFADTEPEVIAFAPVRPPIPRSVMLAEVQERRGMRQFGYQLTDDEAISQGIGIREGIAVGDGVRNPLAPTRVVRERSLELNVDGIRLYLEAAPGETEDQAFVWYEEHGALVCGDNYYGCWPNLYAIRGGPYRDVATWIESLDRLRAFPAESLLPGHTRPILGRQTVAEVLTNFRNALDFVLTETLRCMNRGLDVEATVAEVRLPDNLLQLPYLQEFYGTVAWSVRSIFGGYLGWFDGNPTNQNPLSPQDRATRLIERMGGERAVALAMDRALEANDAQWAAELADLLLAVDSSNRAVRETKARALLDLSRQETSANGRHYYIACAHELMSE